MQQSADKHLFGILHAGFVPRICAVMATPNEWRQRSFIPAFFIMSNAVAHSVRPLTTFSPRTTTACATDAMRGESVERRIRQPQHFGRQDLVFLDQDADLLRRDVRPADHRRQFLDDMGGSAARPPVRYAGEDRLWLKDSCGRRCLGMIGNSVSCPELQPDRFTELELQWIVDHASKPMVEFGFQLSEGLPLASPASPST